MFLSLRERENFHYLNYNFILFLNNLILNDVLLFKFTFKFVIYEPKTLSS